MTLSWARRLHHMARTRSRPLTTNERPTNQFSADQLPADQFSADQFSADQLAADQLSRDGLSRLHDSMAAHVAAGRLPGLVTLWPVATTCTSSLGLEVPATGSADQPLPCGIGWDGGTGTTWRSSLTVASPGSCSRNARSRRRCLLRWSRTSGPVSTPPPRPPDSGPVAPPAGGRSPATAPPGTVPPARVFSSAALGPVRRSVPSPGSSAHSGSSPPIPSDSRSGEVLESASPALIALLRGALAWLSVCAERSAAGYRGTYMNTCPRGKGGRSWRSGSISAAPR